MGITTIAAYCQTIMNYKNEDEKEILDWIHSNGGAVKAKSKIRHAISPTVCLSEDTEIGSSIKYYEEDSYVIEMPITKIQALKDRNKFYVQHLGGYGADMLDKFIRENATETRIRHKSAAVRAAYDEYITLLNIAKTS